jgi:hypothetical protein
MGGACSTYGTLFGKPEGRDHLGDLREGVRIILKWVLRIGRQVVDCIHVAQDRHKEALLGRVMHLFVS